MRGSCRIQMPNTIHYGGDSLHKIGDVSAPLGKKALIISDEIMDGLGYVEKCKELLAEHHIQSSVYLGVHSEPTDEFVDEALKQFQSDDCEFVISLGGGSCIDTAKAIAVLKTNPGDIGEFMGGKRLVEHEPTPHIAIPTTAGTGSEATDVTVITNTKTDVKMMIKQPAFMPTVAIVDPMLTMSVPKSVTAATGVDALSHAIEAYISKKAHPMTDAFAIAAMENILPNIKTAYDNGNNHEAREKMAIGSLQAGIAFSNASVCLVHGMSRPIGAMFHVPHGISNAMLLPAVLEYSQSDCVERLATIGKMFCDRGEKMTEEEYAILAVSKVKELCSYLDIPNLKGWGIEGDVFSEVLPKMAEDAINSGSPANNPKVSNQEEIIELYKRCFTYDFSESVINQ